MKCFYLVFMFCAFIAVSDAQELQDNAEAATILDVGNIESGGYGAFDMRVGSVSLNNNNNTAVFIGARGGWIINSTFSIGGGGYGMVSKLTVDDFAMPESFLEQDYETPIFQVGYGGVFLEYTHNSNDIIHFTVNTLIGAGGASYSSDKQGSDYSNDIYHHEKSAFFVLEPGATIELNVLPFFRISSGISYRFVSGLNLSLNSKTDLNSISYTVAFKFGKF